MNSSHRVTSSVWAVGDWPIVALFADELSAWEFLSLHREEGWSEPIEYDVGKYDNISDDACDARARHTEMHR